MKNKLFLITVTILIVSILILLLNLFTNNDITTTSHQPTIHKNIPTTNTKKTFYMIPVSNLSGTGDTTLEYIETQEMITYHQNKELIPPNISISKFISDTSELILNTNQIGLLTPEQVTPDLQTIRINGMYFWDKDLDLDKYPLKIALNKNNTQYIEPLKHEFTQEKLNHFFAGGEIIPARAVDRLALNVFDNYTYLFDFFSNDIKNADISIALLENSLLGDPSPCTGCMSFRGDNQVAKGLAEIGFDFLSTAGNHAGDAGKLAYANTAKLLKQNKIQFTGTGNRMEIGDSNDILTNDTGDIIWSVINPAIKDIDGWKVGMLSADNVARYYWKKNNDSGNWGTNTFAKYENGYDIDEEKIKLINQIKDQYEIDYLIIYMSWGIEYTDTASKFQQTLGHALIDGGADIIIGSHPHWVQNIELYKNTPIIYSLGNFIFDQSHTLKTRQGMLVKLHYYDQELKSIETIPTQYCGYHQTNNNLTQDYLDKKITLEEVLEYKESEGCIYWQPKPRIEK